MIQGEWICVTEKLPDIGEPVLLYDNGVVQHSVFWLDAEDSAAVTLGYFWDGEGMEDGFPIQNSQYWMPLPDPPFPRLRGTTNKEGIAK